MTLEAALVIGAARALPAAWVAPPLGGPAWAARLAIAGVLVAVAWPAVSAAPDPTAATMARELVVGLTLGLVAAVPFRAAEAAGATLGRAAGARAGIVGDGYALFALALFGALGGPRRTALAWAKSYAAVAVGGASGAGLAIDAVGRIVVAAISLAAPALGALLLADVAGGLIARAQPQLVGLGGGVRLLVVTLVLAMGLAATVAFLGELMR